VNINTGIVEIHPLMHLGNGTHSILEEYEEYYLLGYDLNTLLQTLSTAPVL
jgi:hypothetical protein